MLALLLTISILQLPVALEVSHLKFYFTGGVINVRPYNESISHLWEMQYCQDEVEDLGNHKHLDTVPRCRRWDAIWPLQINSFRLLPLPYSSLTLSFTYTDNYFAAFSVILQRSFARISSHLWPNIINLAPIEISYRTNHVPRVAFIDGGTLNLQILRVRSS